MDTFINISTLAIGRKVLTISMSLKDLTLNLLGLTLEKIGGIQVRDEWTNLPLSEKQIEYGAKDAYASILIYLAIIRGQDPIFDDYSPANIMPGKEVNVYDSTGSRIIAWGVIDSQGSGKYRDYKQGVSATRVVVNINEVLVQGALIPIALSKAKEKAVRYSLSNHINNHHKDLLVEKKNVRPRKPASVKLPTELSSLSPHPTT
jgi:hypothetical protein